MDARTFVSTDTHIRTRVCMHELVCVHMVCFSKCKRTVLYVCAQRERKQCRARNKRTLSQNLCQRAHKIVQVFVVERRIQMLVAIHHDSVVRLEVSQGVREHTDQMVLLKRTSKRNGIKSSKRNYQL